VPHEDGRLWLDAVTRPFMPRLFFPDKDVIDESSLTNKYTGLSIAGTNEGAQISLGYMAESYVDFGMFGMMLPIFLLGLLLGLISRWLMRHRHARGVLGIGMSGSIIFAAAAIETSTAKVIGGLAVSVIVAWILINVIVPRFLPWVRLEHAPSHKC